MRHSAANRKDFPFPARTVQDIAGSPLCVKQFEASTSHPRQSPWHLNFETKLDCLNFALPSPTPFQKWAKNAPLNIERSSLRSTNVVKFSSHQLDFGAVVLFFASKYHSTT